MDSTTGDNCLERAGGLPLAMSSSTVADFVLDDDGSIPTWREARKRMCARISADSPHSPRFGPRWAKQARARFLGADEQAREFCQTTGLLTFTGSPYLTDNRDNLIPPCSFVEALTASRSARRSAFRDVLGDAGGRWVTMRVVGAHRSGYPHEHTVVASEAQLSADDFAPVVGAHLDASPVANKGAHGDEAIHVESDPNTDEMTGGVAYIAPDIPGVRDVLTAEQSGRTPAGVVDEAEHRRRTASVLEATGTQAVRIDRAGVDADH